MLTTKELKGVKVKRPAKPGKEYNKNGLPRHRHTIGKVFKTVFSPDGKRVVGFIVNQRDLLWMFKRPDRFLAVDAFDIQDGFVSPTMGGASWDQKALDRLGVDYDKCIVWEGIEARTPSGFKVGYVDEISFDEVTGTIEGLFIDDGMTSRALVGSIQIPASMMIGYKKGSLVVQEEAASYLPQGGLAAKAGEATAKATSEVKESVRQTNEAATKLATDAIEAGSTGLGRAIGRTKGGFTGAAEEFRKAAGTPKKKPAASGGSTAKKTTTSGSTSTAKKATASGSGTTAKKTTTSTTAKKKSSGDALSDHMKGVGSMFGDFAKEFKKSSK